MVANCSRTVHRLARSETHGDRCDLVCPDLPKVL